MSKENIIKKIQDGTFIMFIVPSMRCTVVFLLIGAFMLFVTVTSYFTSKGYIETNATIVSITYDREDNCYVPVYEFNYNGDMVQANGHFCEEREDIEIGRTTTISYNPKNYKQFDVGSKDDSLIIFVVGLVFFVLAIITLIQYINAIKLYIQTKKEQNTMIN